MERLECEAYVCENAFLVEAAGVWKGTISEALSFSTHITQNIDNTWYYSPGHGEHPEQLFEYP